MPRNHSEQLQQIVGSYVRENGIRPVALRDMAEWALRNNLYQLSHATQVARLTEELGRTIRQIHVTDPQGRNVHAFYHYHDASGGKTLELWESGSGSGPEHHKRMHNSFHLRRLQIVQDCLSLKRDVDSYNENARPPAPVQLDLDFTADVAEEEAVRSIEEASEAAVV
jgi:hypothetical protein